jgi:hypothetical protein
LIKRLIELASAPASQRFGHQRCASSTMPESWLPGRGTVRSGAAFRLISGDPVRHSSQRTLQVIARKAWLGRGSPPRDGGPDG